MKRFLPAMVFIIVALLGAGITLTVYKAIRDTAQAEFESLAGSAADRITTRIEQHLSLLTATHAFMTASSGEVGVGAFRKFVDGLDVEGRYDGIQGLGYARLIAADEVDENLQVTLEASFGLINPIRPAETDQQWRTPIVMLEPHDPRNEQALGFDMFSETKRRVAMQVAMETGEATSSAPVELVQEITSSKQVGFLIYVPFIASPPSDPDVETMPDGFVYAAFRAGDLHIAALQAPPILPVVVRTFDVSGAEPVELYRSLGFDELRAPHGMMTSIDADVAGRKWRFEVHSTGGVAQYADFLPVYALCAIVIILAGSLAAGARWQHKAVESAVELHETTRRSLEDKELLVQEMRHRIKNSIARMMAIARQTASSSETLEDFNASFGARMNAMAKAQDLLARSHWGRADLGDLLKTELGQVFGDRVDESSVSGPKINLNERATQALGLVFHELATNALKYSGVAEGKAELSVHWRFEGKGAKRVLIVEWTEHGNVVAGEPESKGFGSRLVQASVQGELGGEITRNYGSDAMVIRFAIPAKSIG